MSKESYPTFTSKEQHELIKLLEIEVADLNSKIRETNDACYMRSLADKAAALSSAVNKVRREQPALEDIKQVTKDITREEAYHIALGYFDYPDDTMPDVLTRTLINSGYTIDSAIFIACKIYQ